MSIKARFLKGGVQIALMQVMQQALLLARNIFVARLLPPEQFGIALTLVTVISALDAISELGIELFLIRSPDIGDAALQNTLHTALVTRGLLSASAIFLIAHPVAKLFGAPDAAWAYQTLAAVPIVRAFVHLDVRRFERDLRFWPGLINNLASSAIGTVTAIVLALEMRSYGAMLFALLMQTAALAAGSHLFAERRYRLGYDRLHTGKLLSYGWPLLANGMLLFLTMQGDRLIVGSMLGMRELAVYGAVAILSTGVAQLVMKISGSLYLPLLSGLTPGESDYERRYELCGAISTVLALGTLITFGTIGAPLAQYAYGAAYVLPPALVALLGAQAAFRMLRSWPQIGFLATANTKALLIANISAVSGMAGMAASLWFGLGVVAAALCLALGEAVAAAVSFLRQRQLGPVSHKAGQQFFAAVCAMAAALMAGHFFNLIPSGLLLQFALALVLSCAGALVVLRCSPSSRIVLAKIYQSAIWKTAK